MRAEGLLLTTNSDLVGAVAGALARRIGEQRYQLWFAGNTRLLLDGAVLTVGVPNHFYLEWLESTFTPILREILPSILGSACNVRFVIDAALFQASREAQSDAKTQTSADKGLKPLAAASNGAAQHLPPQRHYLQLSDFVVGPSNRLAHAAALYLIERPEAASNPLTIHGQPGVGKTHLLEGVYAELRAKRGEAAGLFITAEEFTNRFLPAMHARQLEPFRRQFRQAAALFVDDLHFFAGKEATQREFLHTFETLRKLGRVVAATSACHPRQLPNFLPELADRLQGGGAWAIELPDAETRRALLRAKSSKLGCRLPLDVLDFLAEQLHGNVRELEGALQAVHHYSQVHHQAVDLNVVRAALPHLLQPAQRSVQLRDIEAVVCQVLQIDKKTLHAKSRAPRCSHPRMLAMYLARRWTQASYSEIGHFFGSRNHSTVIAAERKVAVWIDAEQPFRQFDRQITWRELVLEVERGVR